MQTFLISEDYKETARILDRQRLGSQKNEGLMILQTILKGKGGWFNHPIVQAWLPYPGQLALYTLTMCSEWTLRNYRETRSPILRKIINDNQLSYKKPWWIGEERFHNSHKKALLFKKYEHYKQFNWNLEPELNYWWPTKHEDECERITRGVS